MAHQRRPGDEQLPGTGDQDVQMRHHRPRRAQPGDRAEAQRHHRHRGQVVHHQIPAGVGRDVGEPVLLQHFDAAAAPGPLDQPDQRHPQLVGEPLGVDLLLHDPGVGRTAAHGEVVAAEHHAAPLEPRGADHEVGRGEAGQLTVHIGRRPGQRADLVETARVGEPGDPLADGQPAGGVLARDLLRTAHRLRERAPPRQLVDLGLPAHDSPSASTLRCSLFIPFSQRSVCVARLA